MITSAFIILCLCGQSSAPFLPPPPKTGYEAVAKNPLPKKYTRRKKKQNFQLELGLNYDRAWLSESSLQGLSWLFHFSLIKGFGMSYGISYLFEEGTERWDMMFRGGLTYNFKDSNAFNYVFRLGFTFDTISLPDNYVTSKQDQMQFGWYASLGVRLKVWRATHILAEVCFIDLYADADPGDKAIIPSQRGVLLNLGLSWIMPM